MEFTYKLDHYSHGHVKENKARIQKELSEIGSKILVFENITDVIIDMPDDASPQDIFLAGTILGQMIDS